MAQADITMGPEAKIYINDTSFTWTGGSVTLQRKEHDTNDSDQADWDQVRLGRSRLMVEGTFHSDKTRNVHAGPLNVHVDEFIDLKVYPDGDVDMEPYHAADFAVTSLRFDMPSKAGEPVTGSISGGSSGAVIKPGDT